jgi:hypothetical protein
MPVDTDDELAERLTRYVLQGYTTFSALEPIRSRTSRSRRRREWLAMSLAAVAAAGALSAGVIFVHSRGSALNSGGLPAPSPSHPILLFEPAVGCRLSLAGTMSDQASSAVGTGGAAPDSSCRLEAAPLDGGGTQPLSAPPDTPVGPGVVGHTVFVVAKGERLPGGGSGITGLDIQDLASGAWRHVQLAREMPMSDTDELILDPSESQVVIAPTSDTGLADVVDLSSGSIRTLVPTIGGVYEVTAWLADGIHATVPCRSHTTGQSTSCGFVIDPNGYALPLHGPTQSPGILGASRAPAEDGVVHIVGSPDGRQEAVSGTSAVLEGPVSGQLATAYTVRPGEVVRVLAVGDDGSLLLAVARGSSTQELIVSQRGTTPVALPAGLTLSSDLGRAFSLPDGGFVQALPPGQAGQQDALLRVRVDGSSAMLSEHGDLVGVAW